MVRLSMTTMSWSSPSFGDIERACQRLVLRYAELIDSGAAARVAELFTADATWESGARRWVGIDEIRRGFALRQSSPRVSCHFCAPSLVTVTSYDEARAVTSYILLRARAPSETGGPVRSDHELAGYYDDRFLCVRGTWLFSHRRAVVKFDDSRLMGALDPRRSS